MFVCVCGAICWAGLWIKASGTPHSMNGSMTFDSHGFYRVAWRSRFEFSSWSLSKASRLSEEFECMSGRFAGLN